MIRKIILENYMSHGRTEIEPAAGLTVLIGPNNCGKSAVVSALETLARNTAGDFMVRHGAKQARVSVETDDGHTLIWRRKSSGSPSYVIDGREVHRLNRDVPDDLHGLLKLPRVQLNEDDEPFEVHFGQQKSPIFLLDESESRAAMFFSASSDAGRLLEIQDRHRDKVRQNKGRKRDVDAQIARLDSQIEPLAGIDAVQPLMESAQKEHEQISIEIGGIEKLDSTIRQMERAQSHAKICRERASAHEPLKPPPPQDDVNPLASLIQSMQQQARQCERSAAMGAAIGDLHAAPELSDTGPLVTMIRSLVAADTGLKQQSARGVALWSLKEPPLVEDPTQLQSSIRAIDAGERTVRERSAAAQSLAKLLDPPQLDDPAPLASVVKIFSDAQNKLATCTSSAAKAAKMLEDVEREIEDWANANPNCPICGTAITSRQLLESGGHAHG